MIEKKIDHKQYSIFNGYYIALISVHGLIRGTNPEYGCDADTGGQVRYVIELAQSLANCHQIKRVDILTRRIIDPSISEDYGQPIEQISHKAFIVRLASGPLKYLPKEQLWPYLPEFSDAALKYFLKGDYLPSIIHSHYADAGVVAVELARQLKVPHIYTSHSLGRIKKRKLEQAGFLALDIENRFNISKRIFAEEKTIASSDLIIANTEQEVKEQYRLYQEYSPHKTVVISPGVNTQYFQPPKQESSFTTTLNKLKTHLNAPDKPMVLAISRPDECKNTANLIKAYANEPKLQKRANLVVVSGKSQKEPNTMLGARQVVTNLHQLAQAYSLKGQLAILNALPNVQVAELYQLATWTKGVFVNPALSEPFGLTLIEAAAVGLPVVAANDVGPKAILDICQNGKLINPFDNHEISQAILKILSDTYLWREYSIRGLQSVRKHFSWLSYAQKYLELLEKMLNQ